MKVCLSVSLYDSLSVCMTVCLSVCLYDCLSVCMTICLSVCLSVCLLTAQCVLYVNTSLSYVYSI